MRPGIKDRRDESRRGNDFFEDLLHLPAPNAPSARNPCEDQVASKRRIHLQVRYAASASPTPIQTLSATSAISAVVAASLPSAATVSAHVSTGTMNTLVEETVTSTLPPTTDSTEQGDVTEDAIPDDAEYDLRERFPMLKIQRA
ncbi:hypothetical protein PI124_g3186 [Phytophthora idaei]|nr:hypothetical protein PI125_g1897 [Phytophthora idaei]KAG3171742.1 hypothetical protein PI126_g1706 [Phytophthora idaei]KAG3252224.1 hypothetical protein PI124_g3186 [Phytophthora idaei]